VGEAWSGMPVEFGFVAHEDRQFVAYFAYPDDIDADMCIEGPYRRCGQVTVAERRQRRNGAWSPWRSRALDSYVGWDSHNDLSLHVDTEGHLHLTGNMHNSPLWYLRTSRPLDISSLQAMPMVGTDERLVTYPSFFTDDQDRLHFRYRHGSSGSGYWLMNRYDPATGTWSRPVERLFDDSDPDGNTHNAYHRLEEHEGRHHLVWTWRRTPDAATNSDLHYAYSDDLERWYAADGTQIALPFNSSQRRTRVRRILEGQGLINGGFHVGFDRDDEVVVTYQRYRNATQHLVQIYNARFEDGRWSERPFTNWLCPWEIAGLGTLEHVVDVYPVMVGADGRLTQRASCSADIGNSGTWELNDDLERLGETQAEETPTTIPLPPEADENVLGDPYRTKRAELADPAHPDQERYVMRWQTLPSNQDRPAPELPEPSALVIYHSLASA